MNLLSPHPFRTDWAVFHFSHFDTCTECHREAHDDRFSLPVSRKWPQREFTEPGLLFWSSQVHHMSLCLAKEAIALSFLKVSSDWLPLGWHHERSVQRRGQAASTGLLRLPESPTKPSLPSADDPGNMRVQRISLIYSPERRLPFKSNVFKPDTWQTISWK